MPEVLWPIITDAGEKRDWTDLLVHCSRANDRIIDNYFVSSGGPVSSFGTYIDGYLKVGLDSATPERVNDSVIDEMYQTIDEAAQEEGVNDVPAVFAWEDEEILDEEMVPDTNDDDVGVTTTESNNDNSPTQTTPGFTSIVLILCLLIISRITK